MKKTKTIKYLAVLGLLFVFSNSLQGKVIAEYDFVISTSSGPQKVQASIYQNGQLKVRAKKFFKRKHALKLVANPLLNKALIKSLIDDLSSLSYVQTETLERQSICKRLPLPKEEVDHLYVAQDYNFNTEKFEGETKLISGPKGCWLPEEISPETLKGETLAQRIKGSLKALALQQL
jgi:hypothetical protein